MHGEVISYNGKSEFSQKNGLVAPKAAVRLTWNFGQHKANLHSSKS